MSPLICRSNLVAGRRLARATTTTTTTMSSTGGRQTLPTIVKLYDLVTMRSFYYYYHLHHNQHNPWKRHPPIDTRDKRSSSTSFISRRPLQHLVVGNTGRDPIKMNKLIENIFRRNSISVAESGAAGARRRTESLDKPDYKQAIELLNQLQTNADTIKQSVRKEKSSNMNRSLEKTKHFLALLGLPPEDLNQLNVIHVSGTKGKGSTCAFIESILRHNNIKTGFYSSPHLVAVRERIRINGRPLSEEMFASYFMQVYNRLQAALAPDESMPAYFNFLTLMAFHVFRAEKVEAAILEVGIGGEYDCTNVVPAPVVTGVTSLDLDHCNILGDTIEKIAWQKAGIFKPKVAAFTVAQKEEPAMKVLRERAHEKEAPLYVAPSWYLYLQAPNVKLGINGDVQKMNASLAVQMSHYWLSKYHHTQHQVSTLLTTEGTFADTIPLGTNKYAEALANTKWLGRCEIINKLKVTYFLDGAHTLDSMENCCKWFAAESNIVPKQQQHSGASAGEGHKFMAKLKEHLHVSSHQGGDGVYRILIFNCTGQRNPTTLLSKISELVAFDEAIFTPNSIYSVKPIDSDLTNLTVTEQQEKESCLKNLRAWAELNPKQKVSRVSCIDDAMHLVEKISLSKDVVTHVLVTGSVHLVGGFIGLLDPNCCP